MLSDGVDNVVFESGFLEGAGHSEACKDCGPVSVHTIRTMEPFEILYPVLYYLYTDCIHFTTASSGQTVSLTGCRTPPCNAEEIYAIADRLGLDRLKSLAFSFLIETCDETNILSRVFGTQVEQYEEFRNPYESAFYELWNERIRNSSDLTDFINELETETDEVRRKRVTRKYFELTRKMVTVIAPRPGTP